MTAALMTVQTVVPTASYERIALKLGNRQMDLADCAREGYDLVTSVTLPLPDGLAMIVDTLALKRS